MLLVVNHVSSANWSISKRRMLLFQEGYTPDSGLLMFTIDNGAMKDCFPLRISGSVSVPRVIRCIAAVSR